MCSDSKIISACHLKFGDIVALFGRTFQVVGKYKICDSFGSTSRVLLTSCSDSSIITFLALSERLYKNSSNIFELYD